MDIIEGTEHVLPADMVIFAVGQKPDLSCLASDETVEITRLGTVSGDPETQCAARQGLFACGNIVNGPTNVIEAIASGQRAAYSIDRYLNGFVIKGLPVKSLMPPNVKVEIPADVEKHERQSMAYLDPSQRRLNFEEVALGYDSEMAVAEAKRCLNCAGHICKDVCPYNGPQFGAEERPKMQQCDFCVDRWAEKNMPICVNACLAHALDAGPLDEIGGKYGVAQEAEGFRDFVDVKPSIIFKPRFPKSE